MKLFEEILSEGLVKLPFRIIEKIEKIIHDWLITAYWWTIEFELKYGKNKKLKNRKELEEFTNKYRDFVKDNNFPLYIKGKGVSFVLGKKDASSINPSYAKAVRYNQRIRVKFVGTEEMDKHDVSASAIFSPTMIKLRLPFDLEYKTVGYYEKNVEQHIFETIREMYKTFEHELTHAMQHIGIDRSKFTRRDDVNYYGKRVEYKTWLRNAYNDAIEYCKENGNFSNTSFKNWAERGINGMFSFHKKNSPEKYRKAIRELYTELDKAGYIVNV